LVGTVIYLKDQARKKFKSLGKKESKMFSGSGSVTVRLYSLLYKTV
jgi:hypothetical protein